MVAEDRMLVLKNVKSQPARETTFRLDMGRKEIQIEFNLSIRDWRVARSSNAGPGNKSNDRDEHFRFSFPLRQVSELRRVFFTNSGHFAWYLTIRIPPKYFKKVAVDGSILWFRQTDVVYNPGTLQNKSVSLKKPFPIIDLGRWLTYRLVFDMSANNGRYLDHVQQVLTEHNIHIVSLPCDIINQGVRQWQSVFDLIKSSPIPILSRRSKSVELDEVQNSGLQSLWDDPAANLTFEVRYQLEVCISHGYLNEYNMKRDFVDKLASLKPTSARALLEHVAHAEMPILKPMSIFDIREFCGTTARDKIPPYCTLARSVLVSPTTMYVNTPQVETSNRVIRQYSEFEDRFLRVRFAEEKTEVSSVIQFESSMC